MKSSTDSGPTVYCIGETVLDVIFRDGQPVSANPGGSMLNSAVSLGRAGLRVEFISEYGQDEAGRLIDEFLSKNKVGTRYINSYCDGKTALALAFLDRKNDASYSFYKVYPRSRLRMALPSVKKGDVILFGSNYAITPGISGKIQRWVRQSKAEGAFTVYDPNFRKSHLGQLGRVKPWIVKNIGLASLVRGSDEDFMNIFGLMKAGEVKQELGRYGCSNLIITSNSKPVVAWFGDVKLNFKVPPVDQVVSTVGAGDNFNAGVIYALVRGRYTVSGIIGSSDAEGILGSGAAFASEVCGSMENYISGAFASEL